MTRQSYRKQSVAQVIDVMCIYNFVYNTICRWISTCADHTSNMSTFLTVVIINYSMAALSDVSFSSSALHPIVVQLSV